MSGVVGHMMYAILGAKAAGQRKLPVAPIVHRHYASYLAGSYLGCDVQTLPAATCVDSGQEVGYGSEVPERSPITGGAVRPWKLTLGGRQYTPGDIHAMFYGRTHLVFGWSHDERDHALPWDHLPDYCSLVTADAMELYGPGHRQLAYVFGWMTHVVGDSLIKSVRPGITLDLLNGKYTPQNRPIQDLVTFHEVGRKELRLHWPALMTDMAETPVEPVQAHYMRVAKPRGQLSRDFPHHWWPDSEALLDQVLLENRRYQRILNGRLLAQLALTETAAGWQCDEELSRQTGGLSYREMVELADKANFRHALWQMGEAVCELFEQVLQRQPLLQDLPADDGPDWQQLTSRWRHGGR